MDDLISRQAAIIAIRNLYPDMPRVDFMDNISNWQKRNKQYIECENAIEKLPPDGKFGEWIDGKRMGFDGCFVWHRECSLCGYEREDDNPDKDTNYCPNCGARMECEQDG